MSLEKQKSTAAHKTSLLLVMVDLLLLLLPGSGEGFSSLQVAAQESTKVTYRSLAITEATISPDPIVGQITTLSIEVVSPRDETDVSVDVLLPEEIHLAAGELSWHGSLSANQPHVHEISIIVLQEGDWRIHIGVSSQLSETSSIGDGDILHIESTTDSAHVVPSAEYRVTESEYSEIWPSHQEHIPDTSNLIMAGEGPLAADGMVTIEGTLTYDAEEADCFNISTCLTTVLNQPLGGAVVELWESTPPILLATGLSDDSGFYSITVLNEDPDGSGTGIDPVLIIYAMNERIHIVNSSDDPYYVLTPNIGQDVVDGVIPFDHHILQSDTSQAMYIFEKMAQAYKFLQSQVAWGNNDTVEVNYPSGCVIGLIDNACYVGEIYLPDDRSLQPDTIIHEYGHFVLSRYLDNVPIINACLLEGFTHYINGPSNQTCAWSEGWANFFQMAVQSAYDPLYVPNYNSYDFETSADPDLAVDPPPYDIWEATVTAILWDIFDGPSTVEPFYSFDTIQDGFDNFDNGIWHISITAPPYGEAPDILNDFYSAWNEFRDYSCTTSAIYQHHGLEYPPFRYSLTYSVSPPGSGTVSFDPPPLCPESTYSGGTEVALVASPVSDYAFFGWTGDADPSDSSAIILTMNDDKGVTANFVVPEMEVSIIQSSDDAGGPNPRWAGDCSAESADLNEIYLGHCEDGSFVVSGFRFQNVAIPDGAIINAAHLEFTVDGIFTGVIDVEFRGELTNNPAPFSDISWPGDRSPLTNAVIPWPIGDWWLVEQVRSSPDLSAVIQEVIDQPGWTSGNAISIIVRPSGSGTISRRVFAWEREGALRSAKLQIWYTETAPPPAPTKLKAVYEPGDPPDTDDYIPKPAHVALTWAPTSPPSGTTFNVYRGRGIRPPIPLDAAHRIANGLVTGAYDDYDGQPGDVYVVTAVNAAGESNPSNTTIAR